MRILQCCFGEGREFLFSFKASFSVGGLFWELCSRLITCHVLLSLGFVRLFCRYSLNLFVL